MSLDLTTPSTASASGLVPTNGVGPHTLAVDIGGTGIKAAVLDAGGSMVSERVRVPTPVGVEPETVIAAIATLVAPLPAFDRVSVGFPGVIRAGAVRTAVNLGHPRWIGFALADALAELLDRPVRVLNDADLQGLGVIAGKGVEMVITLGTGFGTGLYVDGRVGPHLELAHHPFRKDETYEQQLGNAALERIGKRKWTRRVMKAVARLRALTLFDRLYIGGGNARRLDWDCPGDVRVVDNVAGLTGGIALWRDGC